MPTSLAGVVSLYELEVRVATACHAERPRSSPDSGSARFREIRRLLYVRALAWREFEGEILRAEFYPPVFSPGVGRGCNSLAE